MVYFSGQQKKGLPMFYLQAIAVVVCSAVGLLSLQQRDYKWAAINFGFVGLNIFLAST